MKSAMLMAGVFLLLPLVSFAQDCSQSLTQQTPFDREGQRTVMLDFYKNYPRTEWVVSSKEAAQASPEKREFVEYFKKTIWPRLAKIKNYENHYEFWMVAIDRALYRDEHEKNLWKRRMVYHNQRLSMMQADAQWPEQIRHWAKMAEGLQGELPDYARKLAREIDVNSYPPEAIPLLKRLTVLEAKIQEVANNSPFQKLRVQETKNNSELLAAYIRGEVSFDQAWRQAEAQQPKALVAMGQDVAMRAREVFNEAAILRTQIAQMKGYKTWAELALAKQAPNFVPGFLEIDEVIQLYREALEKTKKPYQQLIEKRLAEVDHSEDPTSLSTLRRSQISFLELPGLDRLRPYLQKENIDEIWRQTMREAGAPETVMANINLDGYPREGKQGHAYMANLSSAKPHAVQLDMNSLSLNAQGEAWQPARIFIVQNFRDDGPDPYRIALHEGGHGQDYSHRRNLIPTLEAQEGSNSWSETHSKTMERLLIDVDFLLAYGKDREGNPLTRELALQAIQEKRVNKIFEFRETVTSSLFDILLWNEVYTEGGKSFVDTSHDLSLQLHSDKTLTYNAANPELDWAYRGFVTGHFYGGLVRHFGYANADIAAQMTVEALLNHFEKTTGRRSLYRQPELVPILRDAYYESGFRKPFPQAVEQFTGQSFSVDAVVREMTDAVQEYKPQRN